MLILPFAFLAVFNYYPLLGAQIAFRSSLDDWLAERPEAIAGGVESRR